MSNIGTNISIIILVHDNAETLSRCITSCINQSLKVGEIIVIDDASTDETRIVCERYNESIKYVYNEQNIGAYRSRYVGVDNATKQWVTFLDADDYLHFDAIKEVVSTQIKTDADIVQMKIWRRFTKLNIHYPLKSKYNSRQALNACLFDDSIFPVQCWGKLYRKQIIQKSAITYNGFWGDDRIFNLPILASSIKIAYSPNAQYYYSWGGKTCNYDANHLNEYKDVCRLKIDFAKNKGFDKLIPNIKSEMVKLLAYHIRQRINYGKFTDDDNLTWLSKELNSSFWSDFGNLSVATIYYVNKKSFSRKLKKIIAKIL